MRNEVQTTFSLAFPMLPSARFSSACIFSPACFRSSSHLFSSAFFFCFACSMNSRTCLSSSASYLALQSNHSCNFLLRSSLAVWFSCCNRAFKRMCSVSALAACLTCSSASSGVTLLISSCFGRFGISCKTAEGGNGDDSPTRATISVLLYCRVGWGKGHSGDKGAGGGTYCSAVWQSGFMAISPARLNR
jgi:hypothetical protein